MYGYTVKFSIASIDECCDEPTNYDKQDLQRAINDAYVHYEYGNASKAWYDSVVRILSSYL